MKKAATMPPEDWKVDVKLQVERGSQVILGKGCLELLESIGRCQSISAAARERGISYRHAWLMVQGMNDAAGAALVESAVGGRHGGGAQLTERGRWTAEVFRAMQEQLQQSAAGLLRNTAAAGPTDVVHVAAAVCLEEVLGQLVGDFNLGQADVRVRTVFGASDELADYILAGAPVDLFLSAGPEPLKRLETAGVVAPRTSVILAENSLAAIGLADQDLPLHSETDLFRQPGHRIAVAEPTCPLGRYTRDYLDRLGHYDDLMARAVRVENSRAVGAAVRARRADVGLVYGSDAANAAGCRLLFKARKTPSPIQLAGAVVLHGRQAKQARALLAFLASPAAAGRLRQFGFLLAPRRKPA